MKQKISLISGLHYVKLCYRGVLFLWALIVWLTSAQRNLAFAEYMANYKPLFLVIWIVLAVEMTARFFPSPVESMGCQKQFAQNYKPTREVIYDRKEANHGLVKVVFSWLALNGAIAALRFTNVISDGVLILIALCYSVCDLICILFFCPFQTWMMKNRCCATCRIYNWDYLMMCTPLLMIPSLYTLSLSAMALALFIRWEITAARHPERFSVNANASLKCANCKEKLCHHKKQLHTLWEREMRRLKF